MDTARWERVQALFHAALEQPEQKRRAFVAAEAGDLADEVLDLLEEDASRGSLLDRDLGSVAHGILDTRGPALRTIGPYGVLKELGRGGMGIVYLAERDDLGHRVAIKVLRDAALSPARRERFAQEERTLARLNHPAIAQLYDADTLPNGTPYFVMEVVEGVPITDYCATHACSIRERLRLFRAVCEAVQYAHRQAIIHRDLKPSNILVNEVDDGHPSVKLLDFGIAKSLDDRDVRQTQVGLRLMTPAYAAPEQLRGDPVGVYTDVWALGTLLYELLAGQHPFDLDGQTAGQVEAQILRREPPRPSVVTEHVHRDRRSWADLDVLCLTAMHKEPERRYPTVEALVRDLDHFLVGRPLEARAPSVRYRMGKFIGRHRRLVVSAVVVLALVAGIIGFYTARLADARDAALAEAAKAEQVSDYLIGLFEAGDPYEADSVSVSALLNQGVEQVRVLEGQPTVRAQMLDVLGRVYVLRSQYDRATPLLREAVALRRRAGAPLDLSESLLNLGELYIYTGEIDSAAAVTREALALREDHLSPGHPDLADPLNNLGVILSRQGDYEAAGAFYRLALKIRRTIYQEPHENLGYSLNNLAVNLYRRGDFEAAEAHYREAIAVEKVVYGPDHPEVATALANLGKLFQDQGAHAPAESLLTEALQIRRSSLGDEHYETALSLSQLGGLLRQAGDYARAEPLLREALAMREHILGPSHSSTATTRSHLALVLQEQGDYAAAEPLFRRVIEDYRTGLGEEHWFTGIAYCNLAHLLYRKGALDVSEQVYRTGLAVLRTALPPEHHVLAYNQSRFGAMLADQARFEEAEPLLTRSYERLRVHHGPDHQNTRDAARALATLYEATDRETEAARLYTEAEAAEG